MRRGRNESRNQSGWCKKKRDWGKALVSLYPTQGGFAVQIILGEADTHTALDLKLGKRVRQSIEQAHPYPEGRWLFIPIKSQRDLKDAQQLVTLKGGTRRLAE